VSGQIETHNTNSEAHGDIRSLIANLSTLVGNTAVSAQIASAVEEINSSLSQKSQVQIITWEVDD
jgi:hypothetical protein